MVLVRQEISMGVPNSVPDTPFKNEPGRPCLSPPTLTKDRITSSSATVHTGISMEDAMPWLRFTPEIDRFGPAARPSSQFLEVLWLSM
jgi:hypothetical protein